MAAYSRLLEQYADREDNFKDTRYFTLREIAHEAGMYPSQALGGLRELQVAGVLKCMMTPPNNELHLPEARQRPREHWYTPLPGHGLRP